MQEDEAWIKFQRCSKEGYKLQASLEVEGFALGMDTLSYIWRSIEHQQSSIWSDSLVKSQEVSHKDYLERVHRFRVTQVQ